MVSCFDEAGAVGDVLSAVAFAARKHEGQFRKGETASSYIHHPIRVANLLWQVGGVRDTGVLVAALLHDTLEDTDTVPEEIAEAFGDAVLAVVQEVSDDKSLSKAERKRLQVEHAPHRSVPAKLIKLADKLDNVRELGADPPPAWSLERRIAYLDWADRVVAGLRGVNGALTSAYDDAVCEARARILG
jgi:guanosine-3',5'-bis(diphosphate) 3'-pyrophosphohydrolase